MNDIEKLLEQKKLDLEEIKAPASLEERLRDALDRHAAAEQTGKRKSRHKAAMAGLYRNWTIAAVALFLLFAVYNFDILAYYGKKLIGYEGVMNTTLRNLNESGKGQIIGKSCTFSDGTIIILEGIMLDENQLLAFYSIKNSSGALNVMDSLPRVEIKGFLSTHIMNSGQGELKEEEKVIKYMGSFDSPKFYERKLTINFTLDKIQNGRGETRSLSFVLDRASAMGRTLKKSINKSVDAGKVKVKFESLLASPTRTTLEGSIQNIFQLVLDQIQGERTRPQDLAIELIANGRTVEEQGGSMSTDQKGITFSKNYDALPENLNKLQIKLVSFGADHDVAEEIKLQEGESVPDREIMGQKLQISKVDISDGSTYVTITTEESVKLTKVNLMADGEKVELEKTIEGQVDKLSDGTITHTRTLKFAGTGKNLVMKIERMSYNTLYNEIIDIPID